jgi:hypothetical protein
VEKGSLFVNNMPITTNNSENRYNKESELNNSIYVNKGAAGNKTLKNA